MSGKFILEGTIAVPCNNNFAWVRWMERADRCIARTNVGALVVSTVFLGIDHSFGRGDPLLFETMIFGEDAEYENLESYCERYSTWAEAEEGHARAVEVAKQRVSSAEVLLQPSKEPPPKITENLP
jgi:hypothetical protein